MRQRLEQVLELYQPRVQERERVYTISDLERLSAIELYTGDFGGFKTGSLGNIFATYDLGELTGDSDLKGWKLQERLTSRISIIRI